MIAAVAWPGTAAVVVVVALEQAVPVLTAHIVLRTISDIAARDHARIEALVCRAALLTVCLSALVVVSARLSEMKWSSTTASRTRTGRGSRPS